MKVLIQQLRDEHFQIKWLLFQVAAAVHARAPAHIKTEVHRLSVVVLGHISYQRMVLPEVVRLNELKGDAARATRVRLFARELEFIDHAVRAVLRPLEASPAAPTALSDWAGAREIIDALLAEEFALLELHMTGDGKERRQMPRVDCDCPAVLKGRGEDTAKVCDLSLSGLRMELEHPLAVGTFIDLRLLLPGSPAPVDVMAEVRWLTGGATGARGVGARFVDLQPYAGLAIASWVATAAVRRGRVAPHAR